MGRGLQKPQSDAAAAIDVPSLVSDQWELLSGLHKIYNTYQTYRRW